MEKLSKEKALEIAKKLFNLSKRAGTPGEEAAALANLKDLCEKYQLSMLEASTETIEREYGVVEDRFVSSYTQAKFPRWAGQLAKALSIGMDCDFIIAANAIGKAVLIFIGQESDAALAKWFYVRLSDELYAEATRRAKQRHFSTAGRNEFRENFIMGAAFTIRDRLEAERKKRELADPKVGTLVVMKNNLVANYLADKYPELKHRENNWKPGLGLLEGQQYGHQIQISSNQVTQKQGRIE